MTVKGGTTPACAVCKYQRRKCSPNCPLAPYFPSNQHKTFQNVHRLFGVSNITKILESLATDDQKEDAMKSIIYEAEMRKRFPVHGCLVIISQLRFQLQCALEELRCVYAQIASCTERMCFESFDPGPSTSQTGVVGSRFQTQKNEQYPYPFQYPTFLNEQYGGFCGPFPIVNNDNNNNNLVAIQAQMNAIGIGHQDDDERNDILFQNFEAMNIAKAEFQSSPITTAENISESELKTAAAAANRFPNF